MRAILLILPVLMLTTLAPTTSHADQYRWCAEYGGRDGGGRNCGFVTYEQCMATISGVGGFCEPNPFYTGPERRAPRKQKRSYN